MAIEIVSFPVFPLKRLIFHSDVKVYQRVTMKKSGVPTRFLRVLTRRLIAFSQSFFRTKFAAQACHSCCDLDFAPETFQACWPQVRFLRNLRQIKMESDDNYKKINKKLGFDISTMVTFDISTMVTLDISTINIPIWQ